jgi:hypothetical protein
MGNLSEPGMVDIREPEHTSISDFLLSNPLMMIHCATQVGLVWSSEPVPLSNCKLQRKLNHLHIDLDPHISDRQLLQRIPLWPYTFIL